MILTNTATNLVTLNCGVGGTPVAVNATGPADSLAPSGWMPGSNGKSWIGLPGRSMAISNLGVVGATANLDWSLYSYFSFTTTTGTALTLTFGKTASTITPSWMIGQIIRIRITGAGTPTITWPSTVTWVGTLAGAGGSASAPLVSDGNQLDVTLICTGYNTFTGRYTAL